MMVKTSSPYQTPFVQKLLKRHSDLSRCLGGDKEFGKLAAVIIQKPLDESLVSLWDSLGGYESLLGILLSLLSLSAESSKSEMRESLMSELSDMLPDKLSQTNTPAERAVILGNRLQEKQIGKGFTVAEIGGSVSCRVLKALGASCAYADAGYRGSCRPLLLWQKAGDFFSNPDDIITLNNYRHKFKGQFDLTVSNRLLDPGSGAEAIADGAGRTSVFAGAMELLAVFSNITKHKGYSIHGGMTVQVPEDFFTYLGFGLVMQTGTHRESITLLEKNEPNPDRFPGGVKIGRKTIFYDVQRNRFSLSPKR